MGRRRVRPRDARLRRGGLARQPLRRPAWRPRLDRVRTVDGTRPSGARHWRWARARTGANRRGWPTGRRLRSGGVWCTTRATGRTPVRRRVHRMYAEEPRGAIGRREEPVTEDPAADAHRRAAFTVRYAYARGNRRRLDYEACSTNTSGCRAASSGSGSTTASAARSRTARSGTRTAGSSASRCTTVISSSTASSSRTDSRRPAFSRREGDRASPGDDRRDGHRGQPPDTPTGRICGRLAAGGRGRGRDRRLGDPGRLHRDRPLPRSTTC